ncbi:serine/threonine-protein kinase [Mycobacterium avium]|uniref:serine/threonine-protein kinase n=1 Tax=Mycobacterium avium TaxID=1764 RepID=UPI001CC6424A|nr:serine/threonine-protein kinase [Mycobacterium avium]
MTLPAVFANRYELRSQLGNGAQGEVYEAWDRIEQDTVAVKLLGPTMNPLGPWVEAVILRNLSDHHILPIRNADVHLGRAFLVTVLASNGGIDSRISSAGTCGLTTDDTVRWIRQACYGVARGHDSGILHNDIKPANLFLNSTDECVVADFGFASKLDPSGRSVAAGATATTVAPEVAATWGQGAPDASVRSDIYSLGATAYWMLAGRPAYDFTGVPPNARMATVASTSPPRLQDVAPHVPKWVRDKVEKAMARDPADRHASAHEFAADLGTRPATSRRWIRTDEHVNHLMCWRGVPDRGATYIMCMEAGSRPVDRAISTVSANSGRQIRRGCSTATSSTWPRVVRRLIRDLG